MSLKLLKYLLSLLQTVPVSDEIQDVISLQYVKTLQPQTETSVKPISIMCAFANSKLIPILSIILWTIATDEIYSREIDWTFCHPVSMYQRQFEFLKNNKIKVQRW